MRFNKYALRRDRRDRNNFYSGRNMQLLGRKVSGKPFGPAGTYTAYYCYPNYLWPTDPAN